MPCYDDRPGKDHKEAIAKVNTLTDMLCRACRKVTGYEQAQSEYFNRSVYLLPQDVRAWWEQHKKDDAKRALA